MPRQCLRCMWFHCSRSLEASQRRLQETVRPVQVLQKVIQSIARLHDLCACRWCHENGEFATNLFEKILEQKGVPAIEDLGLRNACDWKVVEGTFEVWTTARQVKVPPPSNTFQPSTDSGWILRILTRIQEFWRIPAGIHRNPTEIDRKSLYLGYISSSISYIYLGTGELTKMVYSKILPNQVAALNLCSSSVCYVDHLISRIFL